MTYTLLDCCVIIWKLVLLLGGYLSISRSNLFTNSWLLLVHFKQFGLFNYAILNSTLTYSLMNMRQLHIFFQLSQNLTSDCQLIMCIYLFLPAFAWFAHKIVLQIKTKQFDEHIMQKLVRTGKFTEINKQSHVKFWLSWRKYRTVSYSFSCTDLSW